MRFFILNGEKTIIVQFQFLNNTIAHSWVGMVTGFVPKAYRSDEKELQWVELSRECKQNKKGPQLGTVEME